MEAGRSSFFGPGGPGFIRYVLFADPGGRKKGQAVWMKKSPPLVIPIKTRYNGNNTCFQTGN